MNSFEERYTAWLDDVLEPGEAAKFERELEERGKAEADEDRRLWKLIASDLRTNLGSATVPHPDFINSQVLAAIERDHQKTPIHPGSGGFVWSLRRLVVSGAFCVTLALILSVWWMGGRSHGPSESEFISQVIEARSNDPRHYAYAFQTNAGRGTVLWIEDPGYIPATERLK